MNVSVLLGEERREAGKGTDWLMKTEKEGFVG